MNIAIAFTVARIVCSPYIAYLIVQNRYLDALVWFIFASMTDALDGAIARGFKQQTSTGAWLDPVADKILMLAMFGSLWYTDPHVFPHWFVSIIALKEIALALATILCKIIDPSMEIIPSVLGKLAMALQVGVALAFILQYILFQEVLPLTWPLYITTLVALAALVDYGFTAYRRLKIRF